MEINGEETTHDAETDAYNTMLILKKLTEIKNDSFENVINEYPNSKNGTKNFMLESTRLSILAREKELLATLNGDGTNEIKGYNINKRRLVQFTDNCKPTVQGKGKLKNKRILISSNYEYKHFRQTLNLVQLIVNEGGRVVNSASNANVYMKYDSKNDNDDKRSCKKLAAARSLKKEGQRISIISFKRLLSILDITEKTLDSMPMISFDFLFKSDAIIRDNKDKLAIDSINSKKLNKFTQKY